MRYADRRDAGRVLARALAALEPDRPIVFALPRGGVPVGHEVASALHAPLEVLVVRKIGLPGQEEFAIGALVDGPAPTVLMDEESVRRLAPDAAAVAAIVARETEEARRRQRAYVGLRAPLDPAGRTVIVVDDGIATGASARAALRALRARQPARLVLAVPVAPAESLAGLRADCDAIVCPLVPAGFRAVGAYYDDFDQTSDAEVVALLGATPAPA